MPAPGLESSTCSHRRATFARRLWTILLVTCTLHHHAAAQWWPFNSNFSILSNQIEPNIFSYPKLVSGARRQQLFPKRMQLPCHNMQMRSSSPPNSVHELRPGDIDVVAALGDSLIAGNGAMEEFAAGTFFEHRGVSWCAGGDGTWHQFLTVPNLIKEFNPQLRGYSTGQGEFHAPNSRLNVAVPVSADENLMQQARVLVARMKKDRNINIQKHWKLVTILIGANDLCSSQCFKPASNTGEMHRMQIERALDYLQRHLPRTFVSLVSVVDVLISKRVRTSFSCQVLHRLFCRCYHRGQKPEDIWRLVREYQKAEEELTMSGKYDKRPDFTVVFQPFMKVLDAPWSEIESGNFQYAIDQSYVTYDCFHFSQKGHATMANMYWNNMLEPVGNKSQTSIPHTLMHPFKCPSPQTPYLFTKHNSDNFYRTGRQ